MSITRRNAWLAISTVIAGALVLAGCAAIRVQTDDASEDKLAGRDTYAWLTAVPATASSEGEEVSLERRIRDAADEQLAAKGMARVEPSEADLLLTYGTTVELKTKINDPFYSFYTVDRYEDGTLTLEFLDGETRELLWQGSATTRLRYVARGIGSMPTEYVNTDDERDWRVRQLVGSLLDQELVTRSDEPETEEPKPETMPAKDTASTDT